MFSYTFSYRAKHDKHSAAVDCIFQKMFTIQVNGKLYKKKCYVWID